MSRSLWVEGTKWFCKSINSVFSNIKSKSQSSTTGHIPHSRASLLFLHMKPRLNHELVCTHPFLAHRKIRKGKNLICSVFTTIVHFEEETTGQLYFHLALGFTYETERLFWDHELFWMFSWPELGFFFFFSFYFSTWFSCTWFICQINAFSEMLWIPWHSPFFPEPSELFSSTATGL